MRSRPAISSRAVIAREVHGHCRRAKSWPPPARGGEEAVAATAAAASPPAGVSSVPVDVYRWGVRPSQPVPMLLLLLYSGP